ncbi:MAG: M48 family metallopeptidase [Acidobacteriota bacterium]
MNYRDGYEGKGDIDFEGMKFSFIKRNVRYFRVEFRAEGPVLVLPFGEDPILFLKENKKRIKKNYDKLNTRKEIAEKLSFSKRNSEEFNNIVENYFDHFSAELKVKYRAVKFRKMRKMWGNCRSNGIITLNSNLILLPERIISYIIFHELLHLKVRGGHNLRFKTRMKAKFPDIKEIEEELRSFFIKLNS